MHRNTPIYNIQTFDQLSFNSISQQATLLPFWPLTNFGSKRSIPLTSIVEWKDLRSTQHLTKSIPCNIALDLRYANYDDFSHRREASNEKTRQAVRFSSEQ